MAGKLRGADGLKQAFEALQDEVAQGKIAWSAVRKGAVIIRDKISSNYRSDDSSTPLDVRDYVAIQRASKIAKAGKVVAYRAGIQGGAKKNPDTPYYWRMVEFGTKHVPARPFVRPAAEQSVGPVYLTVAEEVWKGIDRVVKKKAKAGGS